MGGRGGEPDSPFTRSVVINRGEVWWADVPDGGRRPVLVLSRQAAIPVLARVVIAPATRRIRGIPTEVELGREDGMPEPCALSFDNVVTLSKAFLKTRICTVSQARMSAACRAWNAVVDC